MDTRTDPKQQSPKRTKSESDKSDNIPSPTQEKLAANRTIALASKSKDDTQESHQTLDDASALSESEGRVTAVVAKVKYEATESRARRKIEHPGRCCTSNNIIKVLLDSGSDGDLLFHEKGTPMHFPYLTRQVPLSWHTSNGSFLTKGRSEVTLKFFEYSNSREYTVTPDVVEYDKRKMTKPVYDLILGCKTMKELGIVLDFRTKQITIDEFILPMRNINSLASTKIEKAWAVNNSMAQEPMSTKKATQRVVEILDANYEKADLQAVVDATGPHLSLHDKNKLLELLKEFEELFDGTLGDWRTEPVSFELKEGAKPYHGRPYPVPKIRKETTIKELNRLCELGVMEFQPASEWASPSFIIPKSDQTVRMISDFREVNKRLVRKPFPIPKISTVLQELEGFTFATALDLNMGYYTIRLDPDASKICTIIFPWGKYSYLRLPMGIAGSPDIFQAKMSELMVALEYVRTYLDDLLCITRASLDDHLQKLRQVLTRLRDVGLKVNAQNQNSVPQKPSTWDMCSQQMALSHNKRRYRQSSQ